MSRWSLEVGKDSVGRRRAGAAASLQARRVLVIDDDWECIELLSTILAMEGFQVVTASDATRGVAAAQEFEPHIVLVDLMLPPCGGVECALQLRRSERGAGMRLIAVSGKPQDQVLAAVEAGGFDAHHVKPLDLNRLLSLLVAVPCGSEEEA